MRRPAVLAGRPQPETPAQVEVENLRRIDSLVDRAPEIAAGLEACNRNARCGLMICAVDARRYRFRVIRELLAIAKSCPGQHEIATIFLKRYLREILPRWTAGRPNCRRKLTPFARSEGRNPWRRAAVGEAGAASIHWPKHNASMARQSQCRFAQNSAGDTHVESET
jgi:hypothetical protein